MELGEGKWQGGISPVCLQEDVSIQVESFQGAVRPVQGYAAATLMDFFLCE